MKRPSRIVVGCDVSSDRGGVEVEVEVDQEVRQVSHWGHSRWLGGWPASVVVPEIWAWAP